MEETLSDFITFMVVDYPGHLIPYAFTRMAFDLPGLNRTEGLLFYKLGGTGKGLGFSAQPNWNRYVLLEAWRSREDWRRFLADSPVVKRFRKYGREIWWMTMRPIRAHGLWDGKSVFRASSAETTVLSRVAVMTRATIRLGGLPNFWSEVPAVSRSLEKASGLLCSLGFGERPWIRQATFSVWNSPQDFETFAYGDEDHRRVIQRTKDEKWYKEELFARFLPLESGGTWEGKNPVPF